MQKGFALIENELKSFVKYMSNELNFELFIKMTS